MVNERVRGNDLGPTGRTVGENIARVRRSQQMSLQQLEERLESMGRRISLSGLSKIERGERRVDADDLMVLAIALDVAPTSLLLPQGDPGDVVDVSGAHGSLGLFWQWATAEKTPFSRDDRSFRARSLPYWIQDPGPGVTWYGLLQLKMAVGDGELRPIEIHEYTAKSSDDVDWERVRS